MYKLYVCVFKPTHLFYELPFDERLTELEKNIKDAHEWFQKNKEDNSKGIFLGPEYLFKDFSKKLHDLYYTSEQKSTFKKRLLELSQQIDLIIAPGTICWKKAKEENIYYRNMVYFFYQGEIKKYHKKHPYSGSDDDYNPGVRPKGSMTLKERFKFFKTEDKGQYPEIIQIGGLTFGVAICADHLHKQFVYRLEQGIYNNVDIQLVIADGISDRETRPASINNLVFIKVEKRDDFSTLIGTITATQAESDFSIHKAQNLNEDSSPLQFYECVIPSNTVANEQKAHPV